MKRFGKTAWAPICRRRGVKRIAVPIGAVCVWCKEPVAADDNGIVMGFYDGKQWSPVSYHAECTLREMLGSVAHQEKRCACVGGEGEDDPGLTRRQAAKAAVDHFLGGHKFGDWMEEVM